VFSDKCDSCHDLDTTETGPPLRDKGNTDTGTVSGGVKTRFANAGDAHYTLSRVSQMLTSCQINEVATYVDTQ
jgi:hypothetical protein